MHFIYCGDTIMSLYYTTLFDAATSIVSAVQWQPCKGATSFSELKSTAMHWRRIPIFNMVKGTHLTNALCVLAGNDRTINGVFLGFHEAVRPDDTETSTITLDSNCSNPKLLGSLTLGHMKVLCHFLGREVKHDAAFTCSLQRADHGRCTRSSRNHGGRR